MEVAPPAQPTAVMPTPIPTLADTLRQAAERSNNSVLRAVAIQLAERQR
jgi:hypothetical protein